MRNDNEVSVMIFSTSLNRRCGVSWPNRKRWRKIRGDNRKLNFHRFPYAVVYSVRADELYIKAIMHLHRRPFYWMHRDLPV